MNNAMADEIKRRRAVAKRAFTRSVKSTTAALESNAPKGTIVKRFSATDDARKEVEKLHMEYETAMAESDEETDNWVAEICSTFDNIELKVDNYLEELKAADESTKNSHQQQLIDRSIEDVRIRRDETGSSFESAYDCLEGILQTTESKLHIVEPLQMAIKKLD